MNKSKQKDSDESNNESESEYGQEKQKEDFLFAQTNKQLQKLCKMINIPHGGSKEKIIDKLMSDDQYKISDFHNKIDAYNFCNNLSDNQLDQFNNMLNLCDAVRDNKICSIIKYTRTLNNILQIINDIKDKKYFIRCNGTIVGKNNCKHYENKPWLGITCTYNDQFIRIFQCISCKTNHSYCTNNKLFKKSEYVLIEKQNYFQKIKKCEICNNNCNMKQNINEFYQIEIDSLRTISDNLALLDYPHGSLLKTIDFAQKKSVLHNTNSLSNFLDCFERSNLRIFASMMNISIHGNVNDLKNRIIDNYVMFNKSIINIFFGYFSVNDIKKICLELHISNKGRRYYLTQEITNYIFNE